MADHIMERLNHKRVHGWAWYQTVESCLSLGTNHKCHTVGTFVFNSLHRVPFPLDSSILTTVIVDGYMHYDS